MFSVRKLNLLGEEVKRLPSLPFVEGERHLKRDGVGAGETRGGNGEGEEAKPRREDRRKVLAALEVLESGRIERLKFE